MKNLIIISFVVATLFSASVSEAVNAKVANTAIDTLLLSDTVQVQDTLSVATDDVTPDTLILDAVADSVVAISTDTVPLAADSLSLPTDSLSMPKDSLAAEISLAADSLSLPTDSLSMPKDSLAAEISLAADSLSVPTDSLSMPKDSLAADSVKVASIPQEKIITEILASRSTYDETLKTPLSVYKKMPERDRALLVSYYKNLIKVDQSAEAYVKAYTPWREAFMSVPGNEKTLDLYIDGVGIIIGNIDSDTLHHNAERIHPLTEDLMELYNLAVRNVDVLNSQIDFTRTKDSITVAKLRAQQVRHYRNFFNLDSIFHSSHHNVVSDDNEQFWENFMFKDSSQVEKMYPWYLEIINSTDKDVDITHIAHFAKLLHFKASRESKKISGAVAKENFLRDRALAEAKANILLANADPTFIVDEKRGINQKDYYASQFRGIENTLNQTAGGFIASNDYAALEKLFNERLSKEGPAVWEEILTSGLQHSDSSELYMQALLNKYQVEPSFDLAIKIANRAGKIDKYKGNALSYYEMAFQQPEFYDLSNFRQAQLYLGMVGTMMKAGRSGAACMKYVDLAKEACPEYPESYMIEAQLFQRAAGGFSKRDYFTYCFSYCVLYDLYANVKKRIQDLQGMGETEVKTALTVEDIEKTMGGCAVNFPPKDEVFMRGLEGKQHAVKLLGRTYKATVRSSK
ncbi:MAG: hypothetical protein IJB60_07340 [Bacteroidaceae bacterium]|nr:hypothetical protein [Bacteroidaceae bacterium]